MLKKLNVLLCICAVVFFLKGPLGAAEGPYVSEAVTPFVFDGDLRDLPVSYPGMPGEPLFDVPLVGPVGPSNIKSVDIGTGDPVVQDSFEGYAMPAPIQNFEGISYISAQVPDTNGDVGPNHYVQIVNVHFAIYDKTGTLLAGPTANNALWAGTGGLCETNNDGDPIVLYDHMADRWLISQFVVWGTQCIAVSRGPDPVSSGWHLYEFNLGSLVNDYPKFGVWPDGYYMGSQRGYGSTSDAWVFDRSRMLSGLSATFQSFNTGGQFMLPSDLDGPVPPTGAPNIFARLVDGAEFGGVDRLELNAFHVDWANPANSTFTSLPDLPTAAFDRELCSGYDLIGRCITQPGTTWLLESLSAWLMYRLQYRNFGTHETLVVNHTVDVGRNLAGIRWYELRKTGASWSIRQQGTYSPDSNHRWMGSIAMDGDGNMALGYSISSSSVFPGIRYTGRLASDPLGTLPQGETQIMAGSGNVTWSYRWGDYSSMSVDPVDECTFWYTQEYMPANTQLWRTRIASFKFPECGVTPPTIAVHDCVLDAQLDGTLTGPWTFDCSNGAIINSGTLVPTSGPVPGAFYWQMSPFIDIIEVGFEAHSNQWLLHGKWEVPGSYLLPIAGNLSQDDQGVWRLGIHGTLPPAEIGGAVTNSALNK